MSPPDAAILTGTRLVEIVLRHGRRKPVEIVVLKEGSARGLSRVVRLAEETRIPVRWLDADVMHEFTGRPSAEIAAVLGEREALRTEDLLTDDAAPALVLVLEGIEDPHNLGDILRTALAARVDLVILDEHAGAMPRDLLARSSAAASECLPLVFTGNLANELDVLHARRVTTTAAVPTGGENLFEARFPERLAPVVGGEHRGLSKRVLDKCRRRVTIPTSPEVQSLSAASSAAVMLFEVVRKRGG
ncbi:MAG: hypothetical protein AMS16_06825 [Planctomycetes bacterium DG_58]|nr:MAG: hypothetical protein AMS16_06825 [Planctomycetes bacterium DG_58]